MGNRNNTVGIFQEHEYLRKECFLFLDDYGSNIANSVIAPIWQNYCVSDNIYADVNEDDLPDIVVARMSAQNATELETMVTKFLEYESWIPVGPGTGMQEMQSLNDFNIFPNPSNGKFSIRYKKNPGTINITILNTLSNVILSANNEEFEDEVITINLYDQPPGLYYIILESDSMKTIRKVVVR